MPETKPILSVIEELENRKLEEFLPHIFEENFWINMIPIKMNLFMKISNENFKFEIDDDFKLDKAGLIVRHFKASGNIYIKDLGNQGSKGYLWEVSIEIPEPKISVFARIRSRDLMEKNSLKIGIFVQKLEFDKKLLEGFGEDAVLFAIRLNLRKTIQNSIKIKK